MVILESKEGNGVGHHPDVATSAVKVWLAPFPVIISHVQNLILHTIRMCRLIVRVGVET